MADEQPKSDNPIDFSDSPKSKVVTLDRGTTFHRQLGTRDLYAIGYSDVGSSIFYALGVTALYALGATPIALALAGIVFICTGLSYAEMSAALPEAGGSSSFARHAFNDLVSFIAGWALLLDYIVTIAISAFTIGPYLAYFFPALKLAAFNIPFAITLILVLLLLNILGIKESTRLSLLLCVADLAIQLSIITIGMLFLFNLPYILHHIRIGVPNVDWSPTWPQFFKGVSVAMVAYIGIESISQLGGEVKNPGKTMPKAFFMTMGTLLIVYFGISTVALSAIHPKVLSTQYLENPLAGIVAMLPIGSSVLGPAVGILGAVILFVAANAGLIGASRLTFSMGEHYQLPRFFYKLHPKFRTPYVSLIFFAGLASLIIFVAKRLTFIADLYNFGAMLAFSLAHLSLIGLRIRRPDLDRPFKIPFNIPVGKIGIPVTAVIGLIGTVAVWIDVILTKPAGRNLGFAWLILGLFFFLFYRQRQKLAAYTTLDIEKVVVKDFSDIRIKKIIVPTRGGSATETVQFAAKLAKDYNAAVTAIYVIEIPATLPLDTFFPEKLLEADGALDRAKAIGREYGLQVETRLVQSRSAGQTIVEAAIKDGADLILLGAMPKATPTPRSALGETVEYVVKNSPCRVWICTVPPRRY